MIWSMVEYAATVIECLICADLVVHFLYPKNKKYTIACFVSILIFDVFVTICLNKFMLFEGALGFIRIIGNFTIALLFMKGTIFEKILVSILSDAALLIISFASLNVLSIIFNITMMDLINGIGLVRLINLFITKFIFFIFTRILIKIKRRDTYMLSLTEWLTLSVVFVITIFVGMEIFNATLQYDLSANNPSIIAAGLALIFINVFVYILMIRMSRKNAEHMELLLDKMQLEVYKNQLAETEKQYNDMNAIRHDIKNHLQCISALLKKNENEKAQLYVTDMLKNKLDFIYQYVKTGNRVVDVIANTKLTLCRNEKIKTVINISDFNLDIDDIDICIVLGNLFDNAIEACREVNEEKLICFEISQQKSYVKIIIKNSICDSILQNNPKLKTSKKDKSLHGIGIKSVKEVIERNGGMMDFYEQNNLFIADVWLPSEKLA